MIDASSKIPTHRPEDPGTDARRELPDPTEISGRASSVRVVRQAIGREAVGRQAVRKSRTAGRRSATPQHPLLPFEANGHEERPEVRRVVPVAAASTECRARGGDPDFASHLGERPLGEVGVKRKRISLDTSSWAGSPGFLQQPGSLQQPGAEPLGTVGENARSSDRRVQPEGGAETAGVSGARLVSIAGICVDNLPAPRGRTPRIVESLGALETVATAFVVSVFLAAAICL